MSIIHSIRSQLSPIHPEGYPFVGGFALVSLILFWLWSPLGWLGTVATLWCAYFFRDPARVTPVRDGIVVAPADGLVSQVANAVPAARVRCGGKCTRAVVPLPSSLSNVTVPPCCRIIVATMVRPNPVPA